MAKEVFVGELLAGILPLRVAGSKLNDTHFHLYAEIKE